MQKSLLISIVSLALLAGGTVAAAAEHRCGAGEQCTMDGSPGPASRAALGITITDESADGASGKVAGVEVAGVMPGSGADKAGIQVGDLLTRINSQSLAAKSRAAANAGLIRFMQSVNPGEELTVAYQRGDKAATVKVEAQAAPRRMAGRDGWPAFMGFAERMMRGHHGALAGVELADVNPGLGRYFGTDSGVLVLSVDSDAGLPLQDGDVITAIDGRVPKDAEHAERILDSYAPGEEISLAILRDRKKKTLKFNVAEPAAHEPQRRHHRGTAPAPRPKPYPRA